MSGEILRAYLTLGCRTRRFKTYTDYLPLPSMLPPGQFYTSKLTFEQGKQFLWTGTALYGNTPEVLIQFKLLKNNKLLQLDPTIISSSYGFSIAQNCENPTGEYVLFDSDESLEISVGHSVTAGTSQNIHVALIGIEFIK